ncbi:MAG TPA: hypothetical protein VNM90_11825, partial [Haliangium sp.]|nr:hypothetical protein [Haliangium sp.]
IGRDGLIAGKPQAEAEEEIDVIDELGEPGPTDGDPTVLGGPNFEEILGKPVPGKQGDDSADFNEEAPTEIFGEVESNDVPAEKVAQVLREMAQPKIQTSDMGGSGDAAAALAQGRTLLQPSGSAAVRSVSMVSSVAALPLAPGPETSYGTQSSDFARYTGQSAALPRVQPGGGMGFGATSTMARLPATSARERERSSKPSLVKDVAIGVGIALLVLGLFVLVKYVFFSSKVAAPAPATVQLLGSISISVPADKRASVSVDGRPMGELDGSKPPLMISDLALREHVVEVTAAGAKPCRETVTLTGEDIASNVSCALEPLVTQLVIQGVTAAHDIKINGTSVPEDKRLEPLTLEPDTIYDVSVLLGDKMIDRFSVKLARGEVVRRELPAPGAAPSGGAAGSSHGDRGSPDPAGEQREGDGSGQVQTGAVVKDPPGGK